MWDAVRIEEYPSAAAMAALMQTAELQRVAAEQREYIEDCGIYCIKGLWNKNIPAKAKPGGMGEPDYRCVFPPAAEQAHE